MSNPASSEYRYWAFISCSGKDKAWGRWLHRAIEAYGVPAEYVQHHQTPTGHPTPRRFHPLYRGRDESPSSPDSGVESYNALRASRYLIVICSPDAARSRRVDQEIQTFHGFNRRDRTLAIIVDGEPNTGDDRECFPPALRPLEPIAADARVNGDGKTNAKLKLLAGMLGVGFDALKQRDAHRQFRYLQRVLALSVLFALSLAGLAGLAWYQHNEAVNARKLAEHQRESALSARFRAEGILGELVINLRNEVVGVGNWELAAKIQKLADESYRKLGSEPSLPSYLLCIQAINFCNAGKLATVQGDLPKALAGYRQGVATWERLVRESPEDDNGFALYGLRNAYHHLAGVQRAQNDPAGALDSCRQALLMDERRVQKRSDRPLEEGDIGESCEKLGEVQRAQGDLTGAMASYLRATAIFQRLARLKPDQVTYQRRLGINYNNLAQVQRAQGDLDGTLGSYRQSLAIVEQLAQKEPANAEWQHDLMCSNFWIGEVQIARGDPTGALASCQELSRHLEMLPDGEARQTEWPHKLSVNYNRIVDLQITRGDLDGALASNRLAFAIDERLARRDPGNTAWQCTLSVSYSRYGDVQRAQGDLAGALTSYRQAVEIRERLARKDPGNDQWQRDLAATNYYVGQVLEEQGDLSEAADLYLKFQAAMEQLIRKDPGNTGWQLDLVFACRKLGTVQRARGDLAGAMPSFRKCVEIREHLAGQDPGNAEWQVRLCIAYNELGDAQLGLGDSAKAMDCWRKAYEKLLEIKKTGVQFDAEDDTYLESLKKKSDGVGETNR